MRVARFCTLTRSNPSLALSCSFLLSSTRIFEKKRDCSQSMSSTKTFCAQSDAEAFTVFLQRERFCTTFLISFQVNCVVLSSFSVDLLQVVLGLHRCRFPSGVQNRFSITMSLGLFLSACPIQLIQVNFFRVKLTMLSSC